MRKRQLPHRLARRGFLKGSAAIAGVTAVGTLLPSVALAQQAKLKVGLMLPYTGTFAQLGVATQVDKDKWQDLRDSLRGDLKDKTARFAIVYLIDDFMGTGTSLLRYDEVKTKWKGKLIKFKDSLANALETLGEGGLLEPGWQLCVHHYMGSKAASEAVEAREREARAALVGEGCAMSTPFVSHRDASGASGTRVGALTRAWR